MKVAHLEHFESQKRAFSYFPFGSTPDDKYNLNEIGKLQGFSRQDVKGKNSHPLLGTDSTIVLKA